MHWLLASHAYMPHLQGSRKWITTQVHTAEKAVLQHMVEHFLTSPAVLPLQTTLSLIVCGTGRVAANDGRSSMRAE